MELWYDNNDNWQAAQDALLAGGLTDGLPVVPPTPARVNAMLAAHGFNGAEVLCDLPPLFDRFYSGIEARTCKQCGAVHPGKTAA